MELNEFLFFRKAFYSTNRRGYDFSLCFPDFFTTFPRFFTNKIFQGLQVQTLRSSGSAPDKSYMNN